MSLFEQLLQVQELDTTSDQLRHRHATLPEREELQRGRQRIAAIDASLAEIDAERLDLGLRQKRLEDEVASLEAKVVATDAKLYGGNVNALRELQALQDEIASMRERQGGLEEEILTMMEGNDALTERAGGLTEERSDTERAVDEQATKVAAIEAEIDSELTDVEARRGTASAAIPDALLDEYAKLREQLGGVAVAKLQGDRCLGCHLTLSAVEVDRLKHAPPDEAVHCGECGRILVR